MTDALILLAITYLAAGIAFAAGIDLEAYQNWVGAYVYAVLFWPIEVCRW